MNANTLSIISWWFRRRLQYNKALLFTGLMGFVVQASLLAFNTRTDQISEGLVPNMRIAGMCFAFFLILANIAFTIGSVINLLTGYEKGLSFRNQLFLVGYWFAIVVLIVMMIAFLYLA